jgi:hypothetical protein
MQSSIEADWVVVGGGSAGCVLGGASFMAEPPTSTTIGVISALSMAGGYRPVAQGSVLQAGASTRNR